MRARWRPIVLLPLMAAGVFAAASQAAADPVDQPLQPTSRIETMIPMALRNLMLNQPTVTFLVSVNEQGKLVDHMPVAATHYKLLEAAERSLLDSSFEPARSAGRPVGSTGRVTVNLYDPDQRAFFQGLIDLPSASTPGDLTERRFYESAKEKFVFRRSKASELDHPLETTEARIMLYTDSSGRPAHGKCEVEYWVDQAGTVRFPVIVQSDGEAVSISALLTLQRTKFVHPTRDGAPTYVQVRQAMVFETEGPAAGSAPKK